LQLGRGNRDGAAVQFNSGLVSAPRHNNALSLGRPRKKSNTEVVQGARNALATLLQDVGVDHGGGHIVVPEPWLNGADVGAALKQVRGEGMTTGMCTDVLRQTGTADGHLDGVVDDAGVHVMATGDTGTRVDGDVPGGEDIRPAPCLGGM